MFISYMSKEEYTCNLITRSNQGIIGHAMKLWKVLFSEPVAKFEFFSFFNAWNIGFRVQGSGFRIQGEFEIKGFAESRVYLALFRSLL